MTIHTLTDLASHFEREGRTVEWNRTGEFATNCVAPGHDDSNPSLVFTVKDDRRLYVNCRSGCDQEKVAHLIRDITGASMDGWAIGDGRMSVHVRNAEVVPVDMRRAFQQTFERAEAEYSEDARALVETRFGLSETERRAHGLGSTFYAGTKRLMIPFRDFDGEMHGGQGRALDPSAEVRWASLQNVPGFVWERWGFFPGPETDTVVVTEGPSDALTAVGAGFSALAIRGASLANGNLSPALSAGLAGKRVVVCGDNDEAGRAFASKVRSLLGASVVDVPEQFNDLNAWRMDDPDGFGVFLIDAVENAIENGGKLRTSWGIQNLAKPQEEITPEILTRIDGLALFYPGRSHSIYGETESAKSLVAQIACASELDKGNSVLYIDFESDGASIASRMRTLGVADELIMDSDRFAYVHPENRLETDDDAEAFRRLTQYPASLVVIDGVNEALSLFGLDPDRAPDIAEFYRTFAHRFPKAAVVMIDHVVKSQDNQGRFPNGSQHKVSGLTGAAYRVVPDKANPPAVGKVGSTVLFVAKDRPGKVRAKSGPVRASDRTQEAARVELDSTGEVTTVRVLAPEKIAEGTGPVRNRPTHIMEQIAKELQVHPGLGSRGIREAVTGKVETIAHAIRELVALGYVHTEEDGRMIKHYNTGDPYRAEMDVFPLPAGKNSSSS